MAGKPLFFVGVAELGIDSQNVEANLQKIFDLAGLWEAVLLLYVWENPPTLPTAHWILEVMKPMFSSKREAQAKTTLSGMQWCQVRFYAV